VTKTKIIVVSLFVGAVVGSIVTLEIQVRRLDASMGQHGRELDGVHYHIDSLYDMERGTQVMVWRECLDGGR
jgi:uncharacterized membrane protein YqgA involved in biofilm formation